MFTLLRNLRAMFMLTVANYNLDAPSGPTEAELRLAEAAEISENTREKLMDFQAAMTFFAEEGASVDKSITNTNVEVSKDIQELLNLASLELENEEIKAGKADGWFGNGTESAVKAFQISQGLEADGVVTAEVYSKLENASGIVSYRDAIDAAEALAAQEAANERQSNLQIVAEFDWENKSDASADEIKALQQALQDLGKPVNTIDGIITPGGATEREYNAIQTEVQEMELQVAQTNLENATPGQDALAAEEALEAIQQDIADEADVYSRLELSDSPTAHELKEALKNDPEGKLLLCQLQADMKLLKDAEGNTLYTGAIDGHNGIDKAFGPGTARAVTKALEIHGSITAIRRAARLAEVAVEAENNTGSGRTNKGLDLVAQTDGYESGDLEAFLSEYKVTENMPEAVKEGTESEQQAWIIGQAIEMGDRENSTKTRLTFIDGLSDAGNDRIIDVMKELRANFETMPGQAELVQSMMNGVDLSSEDFARGEVGSENFEAFELGGRIIDTGLLDSAYIATGSERTRDMDGAYQRGTMEVPIWNPDGSINEKFAELDFENATYINGAIVMTMKNGCEGNLVIIPVQRDKYVPPVVPVAPPAPVPRRPRTNVPTPHQPPIVLVPEDTPDIYINARCDFRGDYVEQTWEAIPGWGPFNDRLIGKRILIQDAERCDTGGGDNPDGPGGSVSSGTGTEGGGDEGGGNSDADGGSGNDGDRG